MTPQGSRHTNHKNDLIDKLINMRVKEGKTRLDIFKWLRDEALQQDGTVGYAEKSVYEWMLWAKEETDRRAVQCFGEDIKEDIERWEKMFDSAMEEKDKKMAAHCLEQIGKLKGHYVDKKDVTSKGEQLTEIKLVHVKGKAKDLPDTNFDDLFKDL
jgi:hypothetical protein